MIDVIVVYDRSSATVLEQHQLENDPIAALDIRLSLEIKHRTRPDVEVVLLRAASMDDLKKSHARYFAPETIFANVKTFFEDAVKKTA